MIEMNVVRNPFSGKKSSELISKSKRRVKQLKDRSDKVVDEDKEN